MKLTDTLRGREVILLHPYFTKIYVQIFTHLISPDLLSSDLTISKSNLTLERKILPLNFFFSQNCILCQSQRSDQVLEMLFVCATFYICCYIEVNKILKSKIHIVSKLNICQVTRFCPYHSCWI